MGFELIPHKNAEEWRRSLAKRMAAQIRQDLASERPVVLSLAGGSTPFPVYQALASRDLDWSRVVVIPGDDRCVAHDSEYSNVRNLRDAFSEAPGVTVAPITNADGSDDLETAERVMSAYPMHFTVTLLGMGDDMHTASLFPGSTALASGIDPLSLTDVIQVVPDPLPPEAPFSRISMTSQRLLRSRLILLAIKGQGKRDALRKALDLKDPMQAPIMAILNDAAATTEIHWCP